MKLQDESVFTAIKPFANLPEDEHAKMHSSPDGATKPHSFTFSPIHRVAGDPTSDIVAMFALATAWDVSMLNLLPDNVKGMICVIRNTCNQTVTYRIDGKDAWYLGEGDLHPPEYEDMAVFVDLNLQTHPDARSTPGHCMYWMVRMHENIIRCACLTFSWHLIIIAPLLRRPLRSSTAHLPKQGIRSRLQDTYTCHLCSHCGRYLPPGCSYLLHL